MNTMDRFLRTTIIAVFAGLTLLIALTRGWVYTLWIAVIAGAFWLIFRFSSWMSEGRSKGQESPRVDERYDARTPSAGFHLPFPRFLARWLINRVRGNAYSHLVHDDGRMYMERFWIVNPKAHDNAESRWGIRVHHIMMADLDRHLHDHPFDFWSLVLDGWYVEETPTHRGPCFVGDRETTRSAKRVAGNLALRRCTDRHSITEVSPGGVWTLVVTSPLRQWWGFFQPHGKVYWETYQAIKEVDSK